jgi:hypothetical protein
MIPIYFALASFLLGLSAPLWFGQLLRPVRRIRQSAKWIDKQTVTPPPDTPLTVQCLREHEKCGDRVVVAHHLAEWSRDLQRKIFQTLAVNGAISFVVVVVYVVKQDVQLQAPTATFSDLMRAVAASWPVSILLAASLVEIAVFIKLVSDQAAKYRRIIEDAKPPPMPLRDRIGGLFGGERRSGSGVQVQPDTTPASLSRAVRCPERNAAFISCTHGALRALSSDIRRTDSQLKSVPALYACTQRVRSAFDPFRSFARTGAPPASRRLDAPAWRY